MAKSQCYEHYKTPNGNYWKCQKESSHGGPHYYREYKESDPPSLKIVCLECVESVRIFACLPWRHNDHIDGANNRRTVADWAIAYECSCGRAFGTLMNYECGSKRTTKDISKIPFVEQHLSQLIKAQKEALKREFEKLTVLEWVAEIDHGKGADPF